MEFSDIIRYYSRPEVAEEIVDFCKDRWVAIHTSGKVPQFIRYLEREKRPLTISKFEDIRYILFRFQGLKPRTFYGSVNLYRKLSDATELDNPHNIYKSTPTWDIDGSLETWREVIEISRIIVEEIEKYEVSKSIYLKWSGRGVHVHIHENAFSRDVLSKHHPLDLSYAVVDFILKRAEKRIKDIMMKVDVGERPLKVENEMDMKRVFTTPLSLHKTLDVAVVCFKPNELDEFHISWANPREIRHNKDWREYVEGEADNLALLAIKEVGGYFDRVGGIRTVIEAYKKRVERVRRERVISGKVGRFQVMALLQAARYYILTGDLEKAKSFGLNRAIFYAWAKYHGKDRRYRGSVISTIRGREREKKEFKLGDEVTFITRDGWFIIGDKEQLPSDYDREVVDKIRVVMPYERAWEKAIKYVSRFDKKVLLSQQDFYKKVYEPVRDRFLKSEELEEEYRFFNNL